MSQRRLRSVRAALVNDFRAPCRPEAAQKETTA
jgi:hypothetical protein